MQEQNPDQLESPKRVRRTHSKAFKAQLVAQANAGDVSVAKLAMDHKINANQLRKWMKEADPGSSSSHLVPVSVAAHSTASSGDGTGTVVMELNVGGSLIRIHHTWDPKAVATLVKALR